MTATIMTRAQAASQGLKRYYTGKPCKRGHRSERTTSCGLCLECRRDDYAKNPEPHRERSKNYASAHAEELSATRKSRYAREREAALEYAKAYRAANLEAAKAKQRARHHEQGGKEKSREWRALNREKRRQYDRAQRAKNPEGTRAKYRKWYETDAGRQVATAVVHRRRAKQLVARGSHTAADLAAILEAQSHRCTYCRTDLRKAKRHLDHIQPLSRGGSNDRSNLQYLCAPCNLSKGAKDPISFAQETGRLL